MKAFLFFVIILYSVALSRCDFTVKLQAEDGISTEAKKMPRSNANNGFTVLIKQEAFVTLFFQVTGNRSKECQLKVGNLYYSNDGEADTLALRLNQGSITTPLGIVSTRGATNYGHYWNVFEDTGPIGRSIIAKEGLYNLVIKATKADEYGVELDYVSLQILGCNNNTVYVGAVKSGYIQECANEPNDPCENWTIATVVTGIVSCCITFYALCVAAAQCYCLHMKD